MTSSAYRWPSEPLSGGIQISEQAVEVDLELLLCEITLPLSNLFRRNITYSGIIKMCLRAASNDKGDLFRSTSTEQEIFGGDF